MPMPTLTPKSARNVLFKSDAYRLSSSTCMRSCNSCIESTGTLGPSTVTFSLFEAFQDFLELCARVAEKQCSNVRGMTGLVILRRAFGNNSECISRK